MNSNTASMKVTGTLWDILSLRETETKMKKQKENNLKKTKREKDNTQSQAKKSTEERYWKPKEDNLVPEAQNIWNLPFKPIVLVPAREINACYDSKIRYKLKPHDIFPVIDYSNVKSMVRVKDPRLCRDTVTDELPLFSCNRL